MNSMFFQCVSAKNAKRSGNKIMSIPNFDQRCKICNAFIIYDSSVRDQNGECIRLDLNHKRHFCRSADMIIHECETVNRLLEIVEDANHRDLVSVRLELKIFDE
jgi:hypothetical protein